MPWQNRAHFYVVAAKIMRRVLVNHALSRGRKKRGGSVILVSLTEATSTEYRSAEIIELISSMIHTTESNLPADKNDMQRLSELALWIDCRLLTMRGAFIELANR